MKYVLFLSMLICSLASFAKETKEPARNPASLGPNITLLGDDNATFFYQIKKDGVTCFVAVGNRGYNGAGIDCVGDVEIQKK